MYVAAKNWFFCEELTKIRKNFDYLNLDNRFMFSTQNYINKS